MAHHWWYYAKKKFAPFPGIARAKGPAFLNDHYRQRESEQGLLSRLANLVVWLGFRAWLPFRARSVARKYGFGKAWEMRTRSIARRRFADPNDIALFRIERASAFDHYFRRFETAGISRRINPANWRPDCMLGNKIDFYLHGLLHRLKVPRLYAIVTDGEPTLVSLPEAGELVLKPNGGEGGDGVAILPLPADAGTSASAFAGWLREQCRDRPGEWVAQQRLRPHPGLEGLSLSALPTVRITTMLNERGEYEIVTSVLRFPSDPKVSVDNIKAGGLMAPIDSDTGILGEGCKGRGVGDYSHHPVTNAPISGRQLPHWPQVRELVLDAHARAFRRYSIVGWDVAITADGPYLIEGNGKPCMIVAQRAPRKGLGETRYGALIAWHLAERQAGRDPLAASD